LKRKAVLRQAQDKRVLLVALLALALAACSGQSRPRGPELPPAANPSAVIAAELAFARLAQEKGQWTAFAQYAADDAVMFVPEPVNAKQWLKKQTNPAQAVKWQPYQVWSSCDGTLAVTKGAFQQPNGTVGYFTTVWERHRNGEDYKWVMDQGDTLAQPLAEPEMIAATVADCGGKQFPPAIVSAPSSTIHQGAAKDGTLTWSVAVNPDGSRVVLVNSWDGSGWEHVLREQVAAQ
jgi:predicted small lipoprotein YifL